MKNIINGKPKSIIRLHGHVKKAKTGRRVQWKDLQDRHMKIVELDPPSREGYVKKEANELTGLTPWKQQLSKGAFGGIKDASTSNVKAFRQQWTNCWLQATVKVEPTSGKMDRQFNKKRKLIESNFIDGSKIFNYAYLMKNSYHNAKHLSMPKTNMNDLLVRLAKMNLETTKKRRLEDHLTFEIEQLDKLLLQLKNLIHEINKVTSMSFHNLR